MHGVHGECDRVPGRERSAILVGTEKASNTGGEMASSCALTHCRCSSSSLRLPGPGRGGEGYWALADESTPRRVYGSGFPCKRGQSPRHVKSQTNEKWTAQETADGLAEPVGMTSMPQRATSVGNETRFRWPRWRGCPVFGLPEQRLSFLLLRYGPNTTA